MTIDWFLRNWMYAGFVAGMFLLAIAPVIAEALAPPLLLIYLQLPIYTVHQFEEHDRDRFRHWVNDMLAGGREALTTPTVAFINVICVWAVDLIALYLARFVDLGFGLVAIYLTLVNAVVHIAAAIIKRSYNPGLVTAVVLFLPVGFWALAVVSAAPHITATDHAAALGFAVLLHVGLVIYMRRRIALLSAEPAP